MPICFFACTNYPLYFRPGDQGCFLYELKGGQRWYEKLESGRTCGPKSSPQDLLGRLWGRGATTELFFIAFFLCGGSILFLSLSPLLSFGDHHFPSSCLAHRLPSWTKLGTHLPHIPITHPPAPPLCMLRLVSPQDPSLHPAHSCYHDEPAYRNRTAIGYLSMHSVVYS